MYLRHFIKIPRSASAKTLTSRSSPYTRPTSKLSPTKMSKAPRPKKKVRLSRKDDTSALTESSEMFLLGSDVVPTTF